MNKQSSAVLFCLLVAAMTLLTIEPLAQGVSAANARFAPLFVRHEEGVIANRAVRSSPPNRLLLTYQGAMTLTQRDAGCNFSAAPFTTGTFDVFINFDTNTVSGEFVGGGNGTRRGLRCGSTTGDMVWQQGYSASFSGTYVPATGAVTMAGTLAGNGSHRWENCEDDGESTSCPSGDSGPYAFPIDVTGTLFVFSGTGNGTIQVRDIGLETFGDWQVTGAAITPTTTATPTATSSATVTPTPTATPSSTATATNSATPTATATSTATVPPTSTPTNTPTATSVHDLTVASMEVVQVIQCMDQSQGDTNCADNSVPLVSLKDTAVRLMIDLGQEPLPPLADVTARLRGYRNGQELPGSPLSPHNGFIRVKNRPQRAITNDTLNFRLPRSWLEGTILLEAQVNPFASHPEQNYDNNKLSQVATFQLQPTLDIAYIPIAYKIPETGELVRPVSGIRGAHRLLAQQFPVDQVIYRPWPGFTWDEDLSTWAGGYQLIAELNRRYALASYPIPSQLAGWLSLKGEKIAAGFSNPLWASGQGRVSWQVDAATAFHTLAHEISHNLGRRHVNLADGCGAVDDETDWPYPLSTIREEGFNVSTMEVVPSTKKDVMSYCSSPAGNIWMSPHSYTRLFHSRLVPVPQVRAAAEEAYLLVSGTLFADGGGTLEPAYRFTSAREYEAPPVGTDYCLLLQDDAGTTLEQQCIAVSFVDHFNRGMIESVSFVTVLPNPLGATTVVLKQAETVAATLAASANPPTVTITAPADGQTWSAEQTVQWQGTDSDGDELTYAILYSTDGGATWITLVTNLTETSYVVNTEELAGTSTAQIRVLATDGMNTAHADSAQFTVVDKGPTVAILFPTAADELVEETSILLMGDVYDLEDGLLDETELVWESDRDGRLGTGAELIVPSLSVGEHLLTLRATDSQKMTASETVSVTVRSAVPAIYLPLITR